MVELAATIFVIYFGVPALIGVISMAFLIIAELFQS